MKEKTRELHDQRKWHMFMTALFILLALLGIALIHEKVGVPTAIPLLDFILLILAVFRLTRLFVYDDVMSFVRDLARDIETFGEGDGRIDVKMRPRSGFKRNLFDLLNCPWCVGMWLALLVSFFYFLTSLAWFFIFLLALAGAATLIQIISEILVARDTEQKVEALEAEERISGEGCDCE